MRLRTSQLGETVTAKSSGRTGGRRLSGVHGSFVQRASAEAAAASQMLLVKHGIGGPNIPSFEMLCAAMHALRHRVLRRTHVLATAPLGEIAAAHAPRAASLVTSPAHRHVGLSAGMHPSYMHMHMHVRGNRVSHARAVLMECEDEASIRSQAAVPSTPSGLARVDDAPIKALRVVMHRTTFDRACGGGTRFVVFGPFLEIKSGELMLVSHAEALPSPSYLLPAPAVPIGPASAACPAAISQQFGHEQAFGPG